MSEISLVDKVLRPERVWVAATPSEAHPDGFELWLGPFRIHFDDEADFDAWMEPLSEVKGQLPAQRRLLAAKQAMLGGAA